MCNTVGELIEKLKEFDQSTPLDLTAFCYVGSERNKWVQIKRAWYSDNHGYDKPLDVFVEEYTYDGKTTFCRLSAECDQMDYDGPDLADDD